VLMQHLGMVQNKGFTPLLDSWSDGILDVIENICQQPTKLKSSAVVLIFVLAFSGLLKSTGVVMDKVTYL